MSGLVEVEAGPRLQWHVPSRALDALVGLCLASLAALSSLPYRLAFFAVDEGINYYEAMLIDQGAIIYRDFFEFVTPGVFFLVKWSWEVFGYGVTPIRILLLILYLTAVIILYCIAKRVLEFRAIASLPPLLYISLAKQQSWWSPQHHVFSHFCILISCYLFLLLLEKWRVREALLIGLASGSALCLTQHVGVMLIATNLGWVSWLCWRRWRNDRATSRNVVIGTLVGTSLPISACLVYLLVNGALDAAFECTFKWVLEQYRGYHSEPYFRAGRTAIAHAWTHLPPVGALGRTAFLALVGFGPPLGLVWGLLYLMRGVSPHTGAREYGAYAITWTSSLVMFCTVLSQPTYWSIAQNSTIAYVCLMHPLTLVFRVVVRTGGIRLPSLELTGHSRRGPGLAGSVAGTLCLTVPQQQASFGWLIGAAAGALACGLLYLIPLQTIWSNYEHVTRTRGSRVYLQTPLGRLWTLDQQYASDLSIVMDFVEQRTTPDQTIFVYYWSAYLYSITDRKSSVRYSGTIPGYHTERQTAEMVETIARHRPALIIEDRTLEILKRADDFRIRAYGLHRLDAEPIDVAVKENYTPVIELRWFTIYAPSPVVAEMSSGATPQLMQ